MAFPGAEALTLSATIFHADVDAWLPPSFGVSRPDKDKAAEWDAALRGAQRDRLGLGHPDLDDPAARARGATARAGIEALRKMNKAAASKKGDGEDLGGAQPPVLKAAAAAVDEEEESRTLRASKKTKKNKAIDVFGGGKKKKSSAVPVVHPLLNLKNPIPGYDPEAATSSPTATQTAVATSGSASLPASEPAPASPKCLAKVAKSPLNSLVPTSPVAKSKDTTILGPVGFKRPRELSDDDNDDEDEESNEVNIAAMTKTQLRREKRRLARKKLRKSNKPKA